MGRARECELGLSLCGLDRVADFIACVTHFTECGAAVTLVVTISNWPPGTLKIREALWMIETACSHLLPLSTTMFVLLLIYPQRMYHVWLRGSRYAAMRAACGSIWTEEKDLRLA